MDKSWNEQQQLILDRLEGNLVASASAGSGKTTVMIERIMRLIAKGVPIKRIVVLAYNEAIGQELRAKLREKLSAIMLTSEDNAVFLAEQLDDLESADIGTIDGFCSKLIKEYFQTINIDPNFVIMSQTQKNSEFRRIAIKHIQAHKENKPQEIYELISMLGSEEKLIDTLLKIEDFLEKLPDKEQWLQESAMQAYIQDFAQSNIYLSYAQIVHGEIRYCQRLIGDIVERLYSMGIEKCAEQMEMICKALDRALCATDYEQLRAELTLEQGLDRSLPKRKTYDELMHSEYKRVFKAVKSLFKKEYMESFVQEEIQRQQVVCGAIVAQIVRLVQEVSQDYMEYKATKNLFDFSDLTYWAMQVLASDDISNVLKSRYDSVCVDEFQDANYCQEMILSRISQDNLFVVGDTKQSIYGFRHAEPTILSDKFDSLQKQDALAAVRLNNNYRSDVFILDFVNEVFDNIMIECLSGVDYARHERLAEGTKYEHDSVVNDAFEIKNFVAPKANNNDVYDFGTDIFDIAQAKCGSDISHAVVKEGQWIADEIVRLVGNSNIYDAKIGQWRKVRYGDICVLARARTANVQAILDIIIQRHIPCDVQPLQKNKNNIFVDLLNDILKVVDNDRQDIPLIATLLSPCVAMTYDELAQIRIAHPYEKYYHQAVLLEKDTNAKVTHFYDILTKARMILKSGAVYDVAKYIVYEEGLFDALTLSSEGDSHKHVLKQYLDIIKSADLSLGEYIAGLDKESEFDFESYPNASSNDMVATATIHGSKGLEYPIVFLVDCNKSNNIGDEARRSTSVKVRRKEGITIDSFDADSMTKKQSIFSILYKKLKGNDEVLESMRLFYVALTRARNKIYLTASYNIKMSDYDENIMPSCNSLLGAKSFADWILYVKEQSPLIANRLDFIIAEGQSYSQPKKLPKIVPNSDREGNFADLDKVLDYQYPHQKALELGTKYSVTEINQREAYEDEWGFVANTIDDGVGARERGVNYHAILEHIDYRATTQEMVVEQIGLMIAEGVLQQEETVGVNAVEVAKVLRLPILQYATTVPHLREKKFMLYMPANTILGVDYPQDDILIQGAIDLVIQGDKTIVVDFKKTNKPQDIIVKKYSKQLDIYTMAVEEALGRKVDERYIIEIGRALQIKL